MKLHPHNLLPFLLLSLLAGCSATPEKSLDEIITDAVRNQGTEITPEKIDEKSAEFYIRLASESTGTNRQHYLIKAAELLYQRGDISSAQNQLQNIKPEDIAGAREIQIKLLAARIALANGNPVQSIELLPERRYLNLAQYLEASEIRADASIAMGNLMDAVRTRVEIDPLYIIDQQRELNHEAIWMALSKLPSFILKAEKSDNRIEQGWIELAGIMRNAQSGMSWLQEDILDWGTRYPDHPVSNAFIDRIMDEYLGTYTAGTGIAVLLPMQGRLQAVTEAIKSGLLSAYYEDRLADTKPVIRFYDTSDENTDFMQIYRRAILEGANHIVGPLDKTTINRLAQMSELDVPVLTLNYAENPLSHTSNLYQFGLLPEDEARQAAELAIRHENMSAAILVPDSEWGRRLQTAFQNRYQELGGEVHSIQYFDASADDYTQPIKKLFNLQDSSTRHRELQKLLDTSLIYTPYRRQDIDMIFLAATHHSARGIMPAFKFHHAGDLPVYSTSHVYTGFVDKRADSDLNGMMFCDLPWTLVSDNELRKIFDKTWPEQQNYTRLFALGIDAYHLIRNLNYLQSHDYARFEGQTGNIFLDENRRLHRELLWARFRHGQPVYMNTNITLPATPPSEQDES